MIAQSTGVALKVEARQLKQLHKDKLWDARAEVTRLREDPKGHCAAGEGAAAEAATLGQNQDARAGHRLGEGAA